MNKSEKWSIDDTIDKFNKVGRTIKHEINIDGSKVLKRIFKTEKEMKTFIGRFRIVRDKAAYSKKSRDEIAKMISYLMDHEVAGYELSKINKLIDFDDLEKNDAFVLFEMLLNIYDVKDLIERFDIDYVFTEKKLRGIIKELENELIEYYKEYEVRLKFISMLVYIVHWGQQIIDTLRYHNISDVGFRREDYIFLIIGDANYHLKFLKFTSYEVMETITKRSSISNNVNEFSRSNPSLTVQKGDGARVQISGHRFTPDKQIFYNERVWGDEFISLGKMVKLKTIDEDLYQFLIFLIRGLGRVLITGENSVVGKTTMLKAIIENADTRHSVGFTDTSDETQFYKYMKHLNTGMMIAATEEDQEKAFNAFYKMSLRIIGVGEIISSVQAAQLMSLSMTLDSALLATMHLADTSLIIDAIVDKMLGHKKYPKREYAEKTATEIIDIVIHMERHKTDPSRIILKKVIEVREKEQEEFDIRLVDGNIKDMERNLLYLKQAEIIKHSFTKPYELKTLVEYSYENDEWEYLNKPSEKYTKRIASYLGLSEEKNNFHEYIKRRWSS